MTKVYLAHAISTRGEYDDSKRVANEIRSLGYEVYAAAENDSINDKTNNPTPIDIYNGDVSEILSSDIFVVNISGGHQDGTISEIGVVAGINEIKEDVTEDRYEYLSGDASEVFPNYDIPIDIIAYTSNARLALPQHYHGMASASANHLVLGIIDKWGKWCGTEDGMISELKERIND